MKKLVFILLLAACSEDFKNDPNKYPDICYLGKYKYECKVISIHSCGARAKVRHIGIYECVGPFKRGEP